MDHVAGPYRLRVSSPALKDILQNGGLGAEKVQPLGCVLNWPFLSDACLPCLPQDTLYHQPDHRFQKCIARESHLPFIHLFHKYLWSPNEVQGIFSNRHAFQGSCRKAVTSNPFNSISSEAFAL